jgi:hypothetical protein
MTSIGTIRADGGRRRAALCAALWCGVLSCASGGGRAPQDGELDRFLESYFDTWSRGDMNAYGEHFLDSAVVASLHDGVLSAWAPRHRFVEQQRKLRERGGRAVETMLSSTADRDDRAATVVARWELVKGAGPDRTVTRGIDRFTLVRDGTGSWKIASLVFYATE